MSDVIHTLATRSVVRDGVSGRTMRPYVLRGDAVQERVTATSYRVGGRPERFIECLYVAFVRKGQSGRLFEK